MSRRGKRLELRPGLFAKRPGVLIRLVDAARAAHNPNDLGIIGVLQDGLCQDGIELTIE